MAKEMRDLNKIREGHEFTFGQKEFKWIVVVAGAICVLFFVLGFLIGRNFPSGIFGPGHSSVATSTDYDRDSEEQAKSELPGTRNGFAFYEELSRKSGPGRPETMKSTPEETTPEVPAPDGSSNGGGGDVVSESPPVEEEEATVPLVDDDAVKTYAVEQASAPSDTQEDPGKRISTMYTVQVGAFEDAAGADKMASDLRKRGYASYTMVKTVPDKGVWHRVRVGKYASRAEAEHISSLLEEREKVSTFITLYAE
jgi:cell division protein FtsN